MQVNLMLALIVLLAVVGKADSVAAAAGLLLIGRIVGLERLVPAATLEKGAMFWGLVLITISVLTAFTSGRVTPGQALNVGRTWTGIVAFALSMGTTWLTGRGLYFLSTGSNAELVPALVFGSVLAAVFLKGVPVGPLTTSGILYIVLKLAGRI